MIDWEAFKRQTRARPRKMLGYVLGIAVCFLLLWVVVMMQADTSDTTTVRVDSSGRLDSLYLSSEQSAERLGGQTASPEPSVKIEEQTGDEGPFLNSLPVFIILLAAVSGLWIWIKVRDGNSSGAAAPSFFTEIGSQELSSGQQISAIHINGEFWILSNSMDGLTLLHRFSEEEWDGPKEPSPENGSAHTLFARFLQKEQDKTLQEV